MALFGGYGFGGYAQGEGARAITTEKVSVVITLLVP